MFKLSISKLPASSEVKLNKRSLPLVDKDTFVIGRSEEADLVLPDEYSLISRQHFALKELGADWILIVLSKVNTIQIGDREIGYNEQHVLAEGEHIFLGTYELIFERIIDDNKTQFASVERAKNKLDYPFGEFLDNKSVAPSADDPFGFLDNIEPAKVSDLPEPSLDIVDVFGLDEKKRDVLSINNWPNFEKPIIDRLEGTKEADPFAFMGMDSTSESLFGKEAVTVNDFGSDNAPLNVPTTSHSDISFVHIHPINEPISNILPLPNTFDNSSLSLTDAKKILIDALGLDEERFANTDEKELIKKVGFLLSNSLNLIIDLLRLRSATKLEIGTAATTLTINHNNPLKYSPNSVVALGYLLGKPQIGFMSYQESLKATKDDLVSYNKDLLNVTQKLGKHILQELSPVTIEASLDVKGGFALKIPVQREAKLWTEYKKIYESCNANLDQIIKKVF